MPVMHYRLRWPDDSELEYRNARTLPPRAVLVVGTGQGEILEAADAVYHGINATIDKHISWLHTWGSGWFSGIDRDARYLAEQVERAMGAVMAETH